MMLIAAVIFVTCSKETPQDNTTPTTLTTPTTPTNPTMPKFLSWKGSATDAGYQKSCKLVCLGWLGKSSHTEQKLLRVYRLYNADSIDVSFDTSTIRKIYTSSVLPGEMIVQGDDKILIDGDFTVNGKKVPLVRLMPDGTVDMTFINNLTLTDEVRDIELSRTGDIYVATKKAMELVPTEKQMPPSSSLSRLHHPTGLLPQ